MDWLDKKETKLQSRDIEWEGKKNKKHKLAG